MSESLTEFLLARIAEDEQGTATLTHRPTAAHMLAECEAKRRIVADSARDLARDPDGAGADGDGGPWLAHRVARHLALPYADHPDYREEWRP